MAYIPTTIEGNLTNDLELKVLPKGKCVLNLGIAVDTGVRQDDGSYTDTVEYFNATVWDRLAENAAATFSKGQRVIVTGNLRQRSWNAPDGTRRSAVELSVQGIGPSLRWATADIHKNVKASASVDEADEAGEAIANADVDPMAEPF